MLDRCGGWKGRERVYASGYPGKKLPVSSAYRPGSSPFPRRLACCLLPAFFFHRRPVPIKILMNTNMYIRRKSITIFEYCHVICSVYNLETRSGFNVSEVWSNWVAPGVELGGVGRQIGHYVVEEAPGDNLSQLKALTDRLGVEQKFGSADADSVCTKLEQRAF
ncbi:hypothetical protein L249_2511 [Ophiocordyceps polyrhachis-furcata BCC 54312]|uniref:Uncharacterized protein n=1 Tax=Ophiocordyceps polyrhachis-furcata BCC 54312 TaxID=1330021 RepID=A0A367LSE7_9HYPO|nr:hypothetical protein L249_2511 [Ophiocordyceps polyrhachis-furcata BCC 54312]